MASVFNSGTGSAFGGGTGGRAFGQFRLVNNPEETGFGKYLSQITDPMTKANLGLGDVPENAMNQQFAFNTYLQWLADNGQAPAQLQTFRNKYNDALAAYQVRQAEAPEQNIRLANFLASLDNDQSWRSMGQREAGRTRLFDRVRFAN